MQSAEIAPPFPWRTSEARGHGHRLLGQPRGPTIPTLLFVGRGHAAVSKPLLARPSKCRRGKRGRGTRRKCVRNALTIEEVGKTTRPRGRSFQMARQLVVRPTTSRKTRSAGAWELLTKVPGGRRAFGFPEDRLWAHRAGTATTSPSRSSGGNPGPGLPESRIQAPVASRDNYWHMGVPGPGWPPASEIYFDKGPGSTAARGRSRGGRGPVTLGSMETWSSCRTCLSAVRRQGRLRRSRGSACRSRTSTRAWALSGWASIFARRSTTSTRSIPLSRSSTRGRPRLTEQDYGSRPARERIAARRRRPTWRQRGDADRGTVFLPSNEGGGLRPATAACAASMAQPAPCSPGRAARAAVPSVDRTGFMPQLTAVAIDAMGGAVSPSCARRRPRNIHMVIKRGRRGVRGNAPHRPPRSSTVRRLGGSPSAQAPETVAVRPAGLPACTTPTGFSRSTLTPGDGGPEQGPCSVDEEGFRPPHGGSSAPSGRGTTPREKKKPATGGTFPSMRACSSRRARSRSPATNAADGEATIVRAARGRCAGPGPREPRGMEGPRVVPRTPHPLLCRGAAAQLGRTTASSRPTGPPVANAEVDVTRRADAVWPGLVVHRGTVPGTAKISTRVAPPWAGDRRGAAPGRTSRSHTATPPWCTARLRGAPLGESPAAAGRARENAPGPACGSTSTAHPVAVPVTVLREGRGRR